jgi:oligopeptidase A
VLSQAPFFDFAAIKPEHVVPAMEALVRHIETTFEKRSQSFEPTWEGTMGMSTIIITRFISKA